MIQLTFDPFTMSFDYSVEYRQLSPLEHQSRWEPYKRWWIASNLRWELWRIGWTARLPSQDLDHPQLFHLHRKPLRNQIRLLRSLSNSQIRQPRRSEMSALANSTREGPYTSRCSRQLKRWSTRFSLSRRSLAST